MAALDFIECVGTSTSIWQTGNFLPQDPSPEHDVATAFVNTLLDGHQDIRLKTAFMMGSDNRHSVPYQWTMQRKRLVIDALATQTESNVIISLLYFFQNDAQMFGGMTDLEPLVAAVVHHIASTDDEVAVAGLNYLLSPWRCSLELLDELRILPAVSARLRTISSTDHLAGIIGKLGQHSLFPFDATVSSAIADRMQAASMLDTLDAILARVGQDVPDALPIGIATLVGKIIGHVGKDHASAASNVILGRIVAQINDPVYSKAKAALECFQAAVSNKTDDGSVIGAALLRHGIVPALHAYLNGKHIRNSNCRVFVDVLAGMLTICGGEGLNPAALEMEAIGMPLALETCLSSQHSSPLLSEKARICSIVRTYFGKELNAGDVSSLPIKDRGDFPDPLIPSMTQPYLTVKERQYLELRAAILNKPLWWTKFTDPVIAAKWRDEAVEQGVTQRALSLLFSELAYLAEHEMRTVELASGDVVTVTPGAAKCTTMSDDAIPESLRDALIRQVAVLEDVPDHKKDWHPGSHGKVLDLVHPSLYPLVIGRSLVLSRDRRATAICMPPWDVLSANEHTSCSLADNGSNRFQWLPSEFRVHENGTVSINSYINNLHPVWHNSLYKTIAKVFERFVPLFESVFAYRDGVQLYITDVQEWYATREELQGLKRKMPELPSEDDDAGYKRARRFLRDRRDDSQEDSQDTDDGSAKDCDAANKVGSQAGDKSEYVDRSEDDEEDGDKEEDEDEDKDDDDDDDDDDDYEDNDDDDDDYVDEEEEDQLDFYNQSGFLQPRLPFEFTPPALPFAPVSLRGRNLQVIFKLANIHLTPKKPKYGGGSWHIEGIEGESIVATGIYYYDMDNITTSRLSFRCKPDVDGASFESEQYEYRYYEEVYGFRNEFKIGAQPMGSIQATQGRCIAFPNSWQHHVDPFKLADPSKPGYRKILAFFLVDPTKRIVSTAHVAPQQPAWYETGVSGTGLPAELGTMIAPHVPGTMDLAETHAVRADLMAERSNVSSAGEVEVEAFNFCEH
ncbi:hypothetical protein BC831DRAFT_66906 [Entophlyctis helioformis]|nr:hypothetical protein BC831DRAFT_66906 [Entophlyctis helioformis]